MQYYLALFLFLLHQSECLDYFDISGGRQQTDQQQQQNQQQKDQIQQRPQPSSLYGNQYAPQNQQQNSQQQMSGRNLYGYPQQQQQSPIGIEPGLQQQRQQLEFGRGLQIEQQQRNSSLKNIPGGITNPNQNSYPQGNVLIDVQLRSYVNQDFRLPGNERCTCPSDPRRQQNCIQTNPQKSVWNCLVALSVFVLSADSELKYNETTYQPLNQYGQYPFDQQPTASFQFVLNSAPTAIAVLVHNLGPRLTMDGNLIETNAVTVVDSFIYNLTDNKRDAISISGGGGYSPSVGRHLQGNLQQTELTLSYSMSCRGERGSNGKLLVGPGCDLSCNTSSATGNTAICVNQKSGYYSICRWTLGNTQVGSCQNCPWGIKEDAYCADEQGGVLQPDHAGVVSSFYYNAFIGLSIFTGLLLICFVLLCLLSLKSTIQKKRSRGGATYRAASTSRSNDAAATAAGFNTTAPRLHRGQPEATALNSSAFIGDSIDSNKPPPPYTFRTNGNGAGVHASIAAAAAGPLPLPRSNASTASVAGSSSDVGGAGTTNRERRFPPIVPPMVINSKREKNLSPPRYQPLPHLGINAGTDSLNSSFAGTVPLPPPSVSADV